MSNNQALAVAVSNIRNRNFLIGSVDQNGNWSISSRPNFHGTSSDAETEAKRLTSIGTDGKIYVVLGVRMGAQRPVTVPVTVF